MNFGGLKTTILSYATRADLSAEVAGFVALGEEMIRRDLVAMPLSITLDEDDRPDSATGVYTLPATVSHVRAVYVTGPNGSYPLEQVSLDAMRNVRDTANPYTYAVIGDTIEIRGVPATDSEIEVHYMGWPAALSADGDENSLLTSNASLYIYSGLFFLYQRTQDVELAQGALDTYTASMEKLNEQMGRKLGGASVQQQYVFSGGRGGY